MKAFLFARDEVAVILPAAAAVGLRMFGLFLMLPVLAPYVLQMPGGNWRAAGLAAGAYGLTQALLLFPLGWLSDRIGRRPVMVGGLLVFAAGGFVAAAAETPAAVIAGRALQGCGAISAVALAAVADCVSDQRRALGMAAVGAAIAAAFVAALVAAGPLAAVFGVEGLLALTGWMGLAAAALVAGSKIGGRPPAVAGAGRLNPRLLLPCGGVFAIHAALAMLFVIVPVILAAAVEVGEVWRVYLPAIVLALAVAAGAIMHAARMPRLAAAALLMLAAAAPVAVPAAAAGPWPTAAMLLVFFACFCTLEALLPAAASRLAAPGGRGRAMGLFAVCQALGAFAGSAAIGLAGREYGIICLAAVSIVLALLAVLFFNDIDLISGPKK